VPTESDRPAPGPPADRTVYLVIHGVGDPDPGDTVRELARGMTYHGAATAVVEDRLWLPEPDPAGLDDRTARAFPVPVLRDDANRRELAEVHWADLSRFPVSLLGFVEGAFAVLFGLGTSPTRRPTGWGWRGPGCSASSAGGRRS
jgi:hypothetical protein